MQKVIRDAEIKSEEEVLLSFLEKTKDGTYAPIEKSSLPYSRLVEENLTIDLTDECYYYNVT